MLSLFTERFDYKEYVKKLRHYFTDSCPIDASVSIDLDKIIVVDSDSERKVSVSRHELEKKGEVKDFIAEIIHKCEEELYPRVLFNEEWIVTRIFYSKPGLVLRKISDGTRMIHYIHGDTKPFIEKLLSEQSYTKRADIIKASTISVEPFKTKEERCLNS